LVTAICSDYETQLQQIGYRVVADLAPLLDLPDEAIKAQFISVITKIPDLNRFIKTLRSDFSLWLERCDCLRYKKEIERLHIQSIEDMYELQDKDDDFIRDKFKFIYESKKANFVKLLRAIRGIVI
jgi:hypothetical protein